MATTLSLETAAVAVSAAVVSLGRQYSVSRIIQIRSNSRSPNWTVLVVVVGRNLLGYWREIT